MLSPWPFHLTLGHVFRPCPSPPGLQWARPPSVCLFFNFFFFFSCSLLTVFSLKVPLTGMQRPWRWPPSHLLSGVGVGSFSWLCVQTVSMEGHGACPQPTFCWQACWPIHLYNALMIQMHPVRSTEPAHAGFEMVHTLSFLVMNLSDLLFGNVLGCCKPLHALGCLALPALCDMFLTCDLGYRVSPEHCSLVLSML